MAVSGWKLPWTKSCVYTTPRSLDTTAAMPPTMVRWMNVPTKESRMTSAEVCLI